MFRAAGTKIVHGTRCSFATRATARPWLPAVAQTIPRANVRSGADAFDPDLFTTIANVPVFAEHETTARDGRKLRFTRNELEAIAQRCNQRIRDTGDYAAITLGHTPEDPNGDQPEMIGLAGPFRIGLLGEPGERQRYAILCDYHVYRDKVDLLRQYPRRSPELYLEDRYDQMYLDPIALLGAQAPRLDMGLLYSATRGGRLVEKYAAACPAAGSVFIRSDGDKTDYAASPAAPGATPETPHKEPSPMALSPEDVRQIVDALEQLDWVQYVKQQMAAQAPTATEPAKEPAKPTEEGGAAPAVPAEPPVPPPPPHKPPPPVQGEVPKAPPHDAEKEKLGARHYAAEGSGEGDDPEKAGTASVAGVSDDAIQGTARGSVAGEDDDAKKPLKMARILADQQALKARLADLEDQLAREKHARTYAERYALLSGMRETLVFDVEAEAEMVKDFSPEQFEKYAAALRRNCTRMPVYHDLPTHEDDAVSDAPERPGTKGEREKFIAQHRAKALKYCKDKASAGLDVKYEDVLQLLVEGKQLPP